MIATSARRGQTPVSITCSYIDQLEMHRHVCRAAAVPYIRRIQTRNDGQILCHNAITERKAYEGVGLIHGRGNHLTRSQTKAFIQPLHVNV
jgi:hypothetical protein